MTKKTEFSNKNEKLDDSMKASLKLAFVLYETDFTKVYDENYYLIGKIPINNSDIKNMLEDKPKKKPVFIIDGLVFDLKYKGEKLASKVSGGFFFLYNDKGVDIFEYFTNDIFSGFDEKKELILFKDINNGLLYGKSFDGRRFDIEGQSKNNDYVKSNISNTPQNNTNTIESNPQLSKIQITRILTDRFKKIIKKNSIGAELFINKKLDNPATPEVLLKVLDGDLTYLNDDIKEAKETGNNVEIKTGFSSPKVALLHELYINTTLAGRGGHRGNNMRSFIYDLIILNQYGKLSPIKKLITPESQEKGIEFFKKLSTRYKDKTEMILRVYNSIKFDDEYINLINKQKNIDISIYKAFLISKLYEYTNRIDRGNGIAIINVSKTLMDIK